MVVRELHLAAKPSKKLYRAQQKRVIAGISEGLGEFFKADPNAFRVLFSFLALVFGLGVVLYLILWVLLPSASMINQDELQVISGNIQEIKTRLSPKISGPKKEGEVKTFLSIAVMTVGITAIVLSFSLLTGLLGPKAIIAFLVMATVFASAAVLIK